MFVPQEIINFSSFSKEFWHLQLSWNRICLQPRLDRASCRKVQDERSIDVCSNVVKGGNAAHNRRQGRLDPGSLQCIVNKLTAADVRQTPTSEIPTSTGIFTAADLRFNTAGGSVCVCVCMYHFLHHTHCSPVYS